MLTKGCQNQLQESFKTKLKFQVRGGYSQCNAPNAWFCNNSINNFDPTAVIVLIGFVTAKSSGKNYKTLDILIQILLFESPYQVLSIHRAHIELELSSVPSE